MANMFLDLTNIAGESLDHDHEGKIEVHDWSWGMHNHAPFSITAGDKAAKHARFTHITIHKRIDRSTPTLMQYCAHGMKIPEGTLICRKNDGDKQIEYLTIKLKEVKVYEVDWPLKGGDDVETIMLAFHKVHVEYTVQTNEGDLDKNPKGSTLFDFNIPDPDDVSE